MKNIEEIIFEFNNKLQMTYGKPNMVHTIIMDHESFNETIIELFKSGDFKYKFRPSDMNDLRLAGVRVLARAKETK